MNKKREPYIYKSKRSRSKQIPKPRNDNWWPFAILGFIVIAIIVF
jgi:hypothetical protein